MLASLLTPGHRWTFVVGKGGVGKTTTAAALAVCLADAGERVLALSTDPAHSLGDALRLPLGPEPTAIAEVPGLSAFELDAEREKQRFLDTHRAALRQILERGTYLDEEDVEGFLGMTLPGIDELGAMLRLMRPTGSGDAPRMVVDTAPTGHTLRLLALPGIARGWLAALEAMEAKHRAVAEALGGGHHRGESGRFLDELAADLDRLAERLIDPTHTRFVLVTTPEPVVMAETRRLLNELEAERLPVGGIVVNRATPEPTRGIDFPGIPTALIPPLPEPPCGAAGLRRFAASARRTTAALSHRPVRAEAEAIAVGEPYTPPLDRAIYLVGGKGGVGKSTIAAALASRLAADGTRRVLLLSTDPAGSLGDVFGLEQPGGSTVPAGLELRQVDAVAAWTAFREQYQAETERLFARLLGRGLSVDADRRVVERLVDLVPPGVDELMALLEVVDLAEVPAYNALVLDTAPTGHLLRLLEAPALGLEWSHALLRLLLKYRQVIGLGEAAERILAFSRSLRTLRARLEDRERTMVIAVALPEALSVPETERLLARLDALRLVPEILLVNRVLDAQGGVLPERTAEARRLLEMEHRPAAVAAPEWERGPRGAEELRQFAAEWRRVALTPARSGSPPLSQTWERG
ncbi:arsenical pump-driving ATPase [soil metagenome]